MTTTPSRSARIVGSVEYREGDGPMVPIPRGPVEVQLTPQDATLSWESGDARGSAAMPLSDFKRYCAEGRIEFDGDDDGGDAADAGRTRA